MIPPLIEGAQTSQRTKRDIAQRGRRAEAGEPVHAKSVEQILFQPEGPQGQELQHHPIEAEHKHWPRRRL